MTDVAIVSATRTAIGSFMGTLKDIPAARLGAIVVAEALKRANVAPAEVNDVILGNVLTAAQGMNTARQAALYAGLPHETTALAINHVCGSGLRAVALGLQAIRAGDASVVVAGGQENMSLAPHAHALRAGVKMGDAAFVDTMVYDGLTDIFNNYHMGITAENLADKYQLTRDDMDVFAHRSQEKADAALKSGRFKDEIAPVTIPQRKGDPVVFAQDEQPRLSSVQTLAGLKPAFRKDGRVTAGNASSINDGAAALVLMSTAEAKRRNLTPLAVIRSVGVAGVDPALMGSGPIPAVEQALKKAGWKIGDLDLIEANEAFAAQAIVVNRVLGWDDSKVNVNGGAIALGHPIGASGARVLVTLLHEMAKRNAKKGLATLCIGGGQGVALTVER